VRVPTAAPVPLMGTDCGEPAALSVTCTVEARAPAACGVKVTLIVQVPAGATVPQLFVCEKLLAAPVKTCTSEIVSGALPVFVTVTAWGAELVPTV
jgi:hypothetical protein